MADDIDVKLGELGGQAQQLFTADELRNLAPSMPKNRAARVDWLQNEIITRQTRNRQDLNNLREDPGFQEQVVREQLGGAEVDLAGEAADLGRAFRSKASPVVGAVVSPLLGDDNRTFGGAMDIEGEFADARELFPGRDIQVAMIPDGPTFRPMLMVEGDNGEYQPLNRPGVSAADAGQMLGDLFTLESAGSLLPYLGKGGGLIFRAFKAGVGAMTGAAGDEALNAQQEGMEGSMPEVSDGEARFLANVTNRAMMGFAAGFAGEAVGTALGGTARFVTGYAGTPASSLEQQAIERALKVQGLGAPVYAGQVTPASWVARLRARWSYLDPALREQALQQKLWLGERASDVADKFRDMDGVDQALYIGGMDLRTLEELEREMGKRLAASADAALSNPGRSTISRQGAGEDVQNALLDPTNADAASYRRLGNALLSDLEGKLLDVADDLPGFDLSTQEVQRTARNALAKMPVPQTRPGQASSVLETGEDQLGVGVEEVAKKYSADLRFVLRTLADLPEEGLTSRGTYQVRTTPEGDLNTSPYMVDGNGNIRTSYETIDPGASNASQVAPNSETMRQYGAGGARGEGPPGAQGGQVIGTYDVNGVEVARMLRSKLRDFFGNPLVPVKDSEAQLAKKIYLQLGEVLENTASPEFNRATAQYNKISSRFLGQMDRMKTAGWAAQGNGQKLVNQVSSGSMGFRDALLLKTSLQRTGERGQAAWGQYRQAVANDFIQNPDKIKNLDIEPKTSSLFFDDAEQQALREYGSQVETLQRQGPLAVARRASGVRNTALALFRTIPDNRIFSETFDGLSETNQNIMRFSVVEDLIQRSISPAEKGKPAVFNPAAYTRNLQTLLAGDSGERVKRMLPEDTLRELSDVGTISAFYSDVLGMGDFGAGMNASEMAGKLEPQAGMLSDGIMKGLGKMAQGGLDVLLVKGLSASLAEGKLSRILAPRLREAPTIATQAQALAVLMATASNNDVKTADTDFGRNAKAAAEAARNRALTQRRARGATQ